MIVVDASITMSWCLDDEATTATDELLARVRREGAVAPSLWRYETCNALVTGLRRKRLKEADIARLLELLDGLPITIDINPPNSKRLATLAVAHDLTVYDTAYLALALDRGLPLATLDDALSKAATKTGVAVLPVL
ncbi:MAG: type II toxin-antitoxin system VapC family toxin [Propionibacteriaceae bacterium]|nr:type II toxin-antitoxin system VapC family toxin [Propionibacteriaceae bacterium]